eukprot:scaffold46374_cov66-Phaeocystis_antarctica.AAC.9
MLSRKEASSTLSARKAWRTAHSTGTSARKAAVASRGGVRGSVDGEGVSSCAAAARHTGEERHLAGWKACSCGCSNRALASGCSNANAIITGRTVARSFFQAPSENTSLAIVDVKKEPNASFRAEPVENNGAGLWIARISAEKAP